MGNNDGKKIGGWTRVWVFTSIVYFIAIFVMALYYFPEKSKFLEKKRLIAMVELAQPLIKKSYIDSRAKSAMKAIKQTLETFKKEPNKSSSEVYTYIKESTEKAGKYEESYEKSVNDPLTYGISVEYSKSNYRISFDKFHKKFEYKFDRNENIDEIIKKIENDY